MSCRMTSEVCTTRCQWERAEEWATVRNEMVNQHHSTHTRDTWVKFHMKSRFSQRCQPEVLWHLSVCSDGCFVWSLKHATRRCRARSLLHFLRILQSCFLSYACTKRNASSFLRSKFNHFNPFISLMMSFVGSWDDGKVFNYSQKKKKK